MRVCDRHPADKAVAQITLDGSPVDLCAACLDLMREFIGNPKAPAVDPEPEKKRSILSRLTKSS